jgi:hypothetical protein
VNVGFGGFLAWFDNEVFCYPNDGFDWEYVDVPVAQVSQGL